MEIANFFWMGELSKLEVKCINSFVKNGFKVKLWSYNNLSIPNVESCDANLVLNKEVKLKQTFLGKSEEGATLAAFSDYFRYKVVSIYGGWWFDADCFCLKNESEFKKLRGDLPILACKQNEDFNDAHHIGTAGFYMDENTSYKLINEFEHLLLNINKEEYVRFGFYGPEYFTNFIKNNNFYDGMLPHSFFYAIRWFEVDWMLNAEHLQKALYLTKDSYVSHIWNTQFHTNGTDKGSPNKGSFLDYLYNLYE
jgi:hypothetical protein